MTLIGSSCILDALSLILARTMLSFITQYRIIDCSEEKKDQDDRVRLRPEYDDEKKTGVVVESGRDPYSSSLLKDQLDSSSTPIGLYPMSAISRFTDPSVLGNRSFASFRNCSFNTQEATKNPLMQVKAN